MDITADLIWTDHPAWCPLPRTTTRVIDLPDTSRVVATARGNHLDIAQLENCGSTVTIDEYHLPESFGDNESAALAEPLASIGTVARIRTADLWEAIAAAICYEPTVPAPWDAYKRLCSDLGEPVPVPHSPVYHLFPGPDVILGESAFTLAANGLGDDAAELLLDAADAYTAYAPDWAELASHDLIAALQIINGLSRDAARRIAVDISGNFTFYPHDTEFRAWAAKAAPAIHWPDDEASFTAMWTQITGRYQSDATALLIASSRQPTVSDRLINPQLTNPRSRRFP